jgi:adenosylcobinamide kinase/adenosylcobinamide-phosphate guanylyltransferase
VTVLTGGARSGKSNLAVRLAASLGPPVTFVATAPSEAGMEDRIARHREDRPAEWTTVEEPVDLARALGSIPPEDTAIVDCITLWVSNLMLAEHDDPAIETEAERFVTEATGRIGATIVVTNEVGSGVHPPTSLGLRFQDLMGRVNAIIVAHSDRAFLCVAGRPVALETVDGIWAP